MISLRLRCSPLISHQGTMCFTSNFSQTCKAENVVTLHFWYPTRKNAECFCKFTPKMSPADITLCVGLKPNKFLSGPVNESYLRHSLWLGIRCPGCDPGGQLNLSTAPRRVASSERERDNRSNMSLTEKDKAAVKALWAKVAKVVDTVGGEALGR